MSGPVGSVCRGLYYRSLIAVVTFLYCALCFLGMNNVFMTWLSFTFAMIATGIMLGVSMIERKFQ